MNLQEQAEILIKKYKLEESLSIFGEVHLVGNVALRTTIKPDIDFQVYATKEDFSQIADKIKEKLLEINPRTVDCHKLAQSDKYLITSTINENNTVWTIDISLTEPSNDYLKDAYRFFLDFNEKFNSENRETIKKLKLHFLKQNKLKNSMSYYIYRAVIDTFAKTPEDVLNYINKESELE